MLQDCKEQLMQSSEKWFCDKQTNYFLPIKYISGDFGNLKNSKRNIFLSVLMTMFKTSFH